MKFRILHLILVLAVGVGSCKKNDRGGASGPGPDDNTPPDNWTTTPVKASISGIILNEGKSPFAGVTVKAGDHTTVTDGRGFFHFTDITVDKFAGVVTAEAPGYYKAYRVITVSDKGRNFVLLQLLKKILIGKINAAEGGSLARAGSKITLKANSVVNKITGHNYSGEISVYAEPFSIESDYLPDVLPGSFMAKDSANRRTLLESFGMMVVELTGASGEPLQIAPNKTARLDFLIPAGKEGRAPASMPLWYVDETSGLWIQQGTAVRNGNTYSGEVSHFSYWNVDFPFNRLVDIELTVQDNNGIGIPHARVRIKVGNFDSPQFTITTYTDSTGYIYGPVPANSPMTIEIIDECYQTVYTKSLGPLSANTNLGVVKISPGSNIVTIGGVILNCNNQPVINGWINIIAGFKTYNVKVDNTGHFKVTIVYCNYLQAIITANDIAGNVGSGPAIFSLTDANIGNLQITACGTVSSLFMVAPFIGTFVPNVLTTGYVDATGEEARFRGPRGMVTDASGNIYVADKGNHCIRKITPAGVVTTFAGNGIQGFADGSGSNARFNQPSDVAIDNAGNLFVTDLFNHRIRKITPAGLVTTYAGDGEAMLWNGPAAEASFWLPNSLGFDNNGNLYVTEIGNSTIRKITPNGVVSTLAGTELVSDFADGQGTAAKFKSPAGISLAPSGDFFYVADLYRIRKVSLSGMVTTYAGSGDYGFVDGPISTARFSGIADLFADSDGSLYVATPENFRVRKINTALGIVSTFLGTDILGYSNGLSTTAQIGHPMSITKGPDGIFYFSEGDVRIRKATPL